MGGGVHPDFVVKLDFEIAVDRVPTGARGTTTLIFGQFWPNCAKSPYHAQNHVLECSTCSY